MADTGDQKESKSCAAAATTDGMTKHTTDRLLRIVFVVCKDSGRSSQSFHGGTSTLLLGAEPKEHQNSRLLTIPTRIPNSRTQH
jgi:hypothetical protein